MNPGSAGRWAARLATTTIRRDLFIDGKFVPAVSGERFASVTPRDGTILAQVAAGAAPDIDRAVRSGVRAFESGVWSAADPAQRKTVLLRLAELIEANRDELALLESIDAGKPIGDTLAVDVPKLSLIHI